MTLDDYPYIRQVHAPLTEEQLSPLDDRCKVVQFGTPLSDKDFLRLAEFLSAYPDVPLRVYGYDNLKDLEFLRYFPFLREFQADVWTLGSFEGLRYLSSDLKYLGLGATKSKAHSLRVIERFTELRDLSIEGHTKDISAVEFCSQLESLTLRSVTLPDLSALTSLNHLKHLRLKLGIVGNSRAIGFEHDWRADQASIHLLTVTKARKRPSDATRTSRAPSGALRGAQGPPRFIAGQPCAESFRADRY
jgi:hypothetical protein